MIERLKTGKIDFKRCRTQVKFVRAMVVVESDDGIVGASLSVVKAILDSLFKPIGSWHRQHADPCNRSIGVSFNLIFKYGDIITHPRLLG